MENRKSVIDVKQDVLLAKKLLEAGTPMFVFDLETTGLYPTSDRILSFSAIKVVQDNGINTIVDSMDLFINPGFHIPEKITEINGISDADVMNCPYEEQAVNEIRAFLGERPLVAGYNSTKFDQKFMEALYLRQYGEAFTTLLHLDVMQMAKECVFLKSYKLCNLANALGADIGLTFHRSIDDVIATFRCYDILRRDYELPDKIEEKERISLRNVRYWEGPTWKLRRVYVSAYFPFSEDKIYYDIPRKEWWSTNEKIDLDDVKEQVFRYLKVNTEQDMVNALK